jgi:hypothetical protein
VQGRGVERGVDVGIIMVLCLPFFFLLTPYLSIFFLLYISFNTGSFFLQF